MNSDEQIFIVEFKDDVWHGQGTLTQPDGSKQQGEWKAGVFI
jgi:hypothetical protein